MSNEVQFTAAASQTYYFVVRNSIAQPFNSSGTGAFENYNTNNYASYVNQTTEQGTASSYYAGDFPTEIISGGIYSITAKKQAGGSPLETDPSIATGDLQWTGSGVLSMSTLATSGQIGSIAPIKITKGHMLQNFPFKMVSSADHITPFLSGVISGQISRDGGAFGALQSGNITEIGAGFYKVNLTSGDLNANTAALSFNGVGISGGAADQRDFSIILQKQP